VGWLLSPQIVPSFLIGAKKKLAFTKKEMLLFKITFLKNLWCFPDRISRKSGEPKDIFVISDHNSILKKG